MSEMSAETLTSHRWLLTGSDEDETKGAVHGVRLVFHAEPGRLHGAIIDWRNEEETPLHSLRFDGFDLELQMPIDKDLAGDIATLKLVATGETFEGWWFDSTNVKIGKKLKLVKYSG